MTDHPHALPAEHRLGIYRIERVLSSGEFGIIYYALDTNHNKPVAIKEYLPNDFALRDATTVRPKSATDQDHYQQGLERFLSEALALQHLAHPHLNKIHRFFESNGTAYVVLEYIEGEHLSQALERDSRLDDQRLQRLLNELLSGLKKIHRVGYVHLDIKPSNIMLRPDGSAVLLDFNTAYHAVGQSITSSTPGYRPIEQYDQKIKNVGPWSDFYALGMVAYRCITGLGENEIPDAKERAQLERKGESGLKPAVEAGKGQYKESLLRAVDWAIRVDKDQRPRSVAVLREVLAGGAPKEAGGTASPSAKVATPSSAPAPTKKKSRLASLVLVLTFGATLAAAAVIYWPYLQERQQWQAVECDDEASVRGYLQTYPNGRYQSEAQECLAAIHEEHTAWEAVQCDNEASVRNYLRSYPDGRHSASAQICLKGTGNSLRTFQGHGWIVNSVAFSPDGKYVISGSGDKTLRLWDVQTGNSLRTFQGHTRDVESVAFSPDGKTVISGSVDKTLRLWDVQTGNSLRTFQGHGSRVTSVAFSPDGKYVISSSWDKTLRLWDVQTGNSLRTFQGHTSDVHSVAFSPDGKYVISGSYILGLWDVQTGKPLRIFQGYTHWVFSVAFSPDGKYVISGSFDNTLRLWDVHTGNSLRTFQGHGSRVTSVAFSPNGKYVISGSFDNTLRLWDVHTGKSLRTFQGRTDSVQSVSFSSDGKYVISGSWDKTLRLWDIYAG